MSADSVHTFRVAPNRINAAQARALADLLERGAQAAPEPAEPPPSVVALACFDEPDVDQAKTLAVMSEDGRAWQIVTAGIAWPQERRR